MYCTSPYIVTETCTKGHKRTGSPLRSFHLKEKDQFSERCWLLACDNGQCPELHSCLPHSQELPICKVRACRALMTGNALSMWLKFYLEY